MREILFRGQTRRYGEKVMAGSGEKLPGNWVYGGIFQGKPGGCSIIYTYDTIQKLVVYSDTVGEYTGLIDKKGVKIFEGDIVKATLLPAHTGSSYAIGCVIFENGTYKIAVSISRNTSEYKKYSGENVKAYALENNFINRNYQLEVIGNIHDNPELLNGGDQS